MGQEIGFKMPRTNSNLANIVRTAQVSGGRERAAAIEELVRAWTPQVLAWLVTWPITPQERVELAQEIIVAAVKGVDSIREPERHIAWLRKMTRLKAIDLCKKQERSLVHFSSSLIEELSPHVEVPSRDVLAGKAILKAINNLSEVQREIVLLKWLHGHTSQEIATMMGHTDVAVRQTIHRARQKLQAELKSL